MSEILGIVTYVLKVVELYHRLVFVSGILRKKIKTSSFLQSFQNIVCILYYIVLYFFNRLYKKLKQTQVTFVALFNNVINIFILS